MKDYKHVHKWQRSCQKPVKRVQQLIRFMTIISLVMVVTFLGLTMYARSQEPLEFAKVTITQGDTLWSIAKAYHNSNRDIRDIIEEIRRTNQLTTAQIYPGQVILIPLTD